MAYLTRRFQKMVRRNGGIPKRGSSSKPKNYDLYHKYRKSGHFIKDFPLLKQEQSIHNSDKEAKRNLVPDKYFKRNNAADNVVKQTLTALGDSSSESEEDDDAGDSSMMAFENEANEYDPIFALMAQSDHIEDDDNNEVKFRDVQRNLKSYSPRKLMSLASVLIDALTMELGDTEQTRDDLIVCVVDLKETINNLENEKEVLTKKITSVEHERDDLMVVVVDLKETIENYSKEKNNVVEKVVVIEQERDDLLVVIIDLKKTIEELKAECSPRNSKKGKEVASEAYIKFENELNALQAELEKLQSDLEKSLKWTWSSDAITSIYVNNGGNRQGIGFQRERTPYNPHSKYVTVPDNWLCTYCGNNGYFKENFQAGFILFRKRKFLLKEDRICDKGNKVEFLSNICTITNLVNGEVVLVAKRYKNIYVANFESLQSGDLSCLKVVDDDAKLWHRRLGHASFSLLNKLVQKDLVHGLSKSRFKEHNVCDACARGKHVKSSFKPKKGYHGTEFDNAKFDEFCNENGITHNFSAPRTPQQNRVVERKNRTLEEMARTMLIDSEIAKNFWVEGINTACYLVNRCMIRSLLNKTPYELLNGIKPKLTHLRTFGCKCYVLNNGNDQLGKFDAKSDKGIFLGHSSQSKAYKVYNKQTQCVEESIHVIFDESYLPREKSKKDDQDGEPLLLPGDDK
ncbi:uncharacterized protein LOC142181012 [Nicotiana tabacum]|uniref:Uncharacterized protein LOC142181012 n=1 Tax=Nicotiana tabacum TaxID=4097 RepID=A0AC58UIA3_TOBAC